jgi:hypothetical protein
VLGGRGEGGAGTEEVGQGESEDLGLAGGGVGGDCYEQSGLGRI